MKKKKRTINKINQEELRTSRRGSRLSGGATREDASVKKTIGNRLLLYIDYHSRSDP